jgi:hypothetical protein
MKVLLLSSTLVLLLFSCGKSDQEISDELHAKIQGDWYLPREDDGRVFITNEYVTISFEDTIFANQYASRYSHFTIHSDTLIIDHKELSPGLNQSIQKYKIIYIGENWMKLFPIEKKERKWNTEKGFNDTLCFKKVLSKNSIKPQSIGFFIASTFGSIRPTYIEIKSNREIIYFEDHFDYEVSKKGRLSRSEYAEIIKCIHHLPLKTLKDRYETGATDQCEYAITINYDHKQKHVDSYGLDEAPVELQFLFNKLYLLPTKCQLKDSDKPLNRSYFWHRNICYHWDLPMELPPLKFSEPK